MATLTLIPKPYVGLSGSANTLQVQRLDDRLVIRLDLGQYFFVIFILVAAGGGLPFIAMYGLSKPHGGWFFEYIRYAVWAFSALLWYILFRYLRGMPRIEVPKGSGEIQFFKYRGGGPESVIRWSEIQGFRVNLEPYFSGQASYPQHVLYLQKKSGDAVPLCGSVDEKLIEGLKMELERLFPASP